MELKRIAIYLRVSTDKQALLMQIEAIDKWIASLPPEARPTSRRVFQDEGKSGTRDDRPGFQAMLEACRKGEIDTVVVYRLDRFSRTTYTALRTIMELDQLGVAFIATSQPVLNLGHGMPFRLTIMAAFAEIAAIEQQAIVARIRDGLAAAKARGVKLGHKPISLQKRQRILELWEAGFNKKEIAEDVKVSRTTVWAFLKAEGVDTVRFPLDPMYLDPTIPPWER